MITLRDTSKRVPRVPAAQGPSPWRLLISAYGWIVLGAAYCALFCLGAPSVLLFFISVPYGLVIGAVVAVPGAIILTAMISLFATPPRSAARFTMILEVVGMVGAVVGCFLLVWSQFPIAVQISWSTGTLNDLFAVVSVLAAGRGVGRGLAASHLRACGIAPSPSLIQRLRVH